jgi:hypothetical protein
MNSALIERFLAQLYTDTPLRERFLRHPESEALRAGLDAESARALSCIDRDGLRLAADSFEQKRRSRR